MYDSIQRAPHTNILNIHLHAMPLLFTKLRNEVIAEIMIGQKLFIHFISAKRLPAFVLLHQEVLTKLK